MGGKQSTPTLRPEDVEALVKTTGMEEAQVRKIKEIDKVTFYIYNPRSGRSLTSLSRRTQTGK